MKKTGHVLAILIPILFTVRIGFPQAFDKAKLDRYFQALEENNKFMGSVALSKNGEIIYSRQVGFADIADKVRADENTKYRIGSITKTFTTVLFFKAIEEGKIKLTDKIDRFFPSIKNAEKITTGHLLSHRSGIHNFTDEKDYLQWNTQKKTEQELLAIIAKGGSDFEPGSKAQYSNSNFVLLSFILQKIYRQEFAQILNDKIIKVIGLKNTDFGKKINIKDHACYSYRFNEHWEKETETDLSIPVGAGAIAASSTDLVKFANTLFSGGLISTKNLELMKTKPLKDDFGMGLFQIPFYDKIGYGHGGGIDGFHSVFSCFSGDKVCFAIFSNGLNYELNDISIVVLSAAYNKEYEIPTFKTFEVTGEELDKYTGVYASSQLPMKITVTRNNKALIAQATGQPSFPLEATGKDKFKFDKAQLAMEFNPAEKTMILKQGGGIFNFTKE